MKIHLPDPEMRKFLKMGDVQSVADALKAHVFHGLEVLSLDNDACHIRLDATEVTFPTSQSLKTSVRMANALFEAENVIRQRDHKAV